MHKMDNIEFTGLSIPKESIVLDQSFGIDLTSFLPTKNQPFCDIGFIFTESNYDFDIQNKLEKNCKGNYSIFRSIEDKVLLGFELEDDIIKYKFGVWD